MSHTLTFKDLAAASLDIDIKDESAKRQWRELYFVYANALDNPPAGVIGVGAITYAEFKLAQFQKESI